MSQLEESACQVNELTKANSNLTIELIVFCEHVDKVRAKAIVDFQVSQSYYDELGIQYDDDFEDFCKQATLLFPGMDFS